MKITENLKKITTTQTAFGKAIGKTGPRVNQMIQEGIAVLDPGGDRGAILLFESLKNYFSQKSNNTDNGSEIDFNAEHARLEKLKADKEAIRVAKMEGEVYDASVVEKAMLDIYVTLRTQLLGLPNKIASQLPDEVRAQANTLITKEIEVCLADMAQYTPDMFMSEVTEDE